MNFCVVSAYPKTLESGNLVLVDAHMGVGRYAVRSSVKVERYNPPFYQISIELVDAIFQNDMMHYRYGDRSTRYYFRYNWNTKIISYPLQNSWMDWSLNRDYSHAEGDPLIPYTAEVAFVSAYNMRFFNDKQCYSPILRGYRRVIDEDFYRELGI